MPRPKPAWTPHHPVDDQTNPKAVRRVKRRHGGSEESQNSVIARYEREGFKGQFGARSPGHIVCFTCRKESDAATVKVTALHRLEGSSDPSDEMAVAALTCPSCNTKGTISLSYGVTASIEDRLVLQRLQPIHHRRRRHEGDLRPGV